MGDSVGADDIAYQPSDALRRARGFKTILKNAKARHNAACEKGPCDESVQADELGVMSWVLDALESSEARIEALEKQLAEKGDDDDEPDDG